MGLAHTARDIASVLRPERLVITDERLDRLPLWSKELNSELDRLSDDLVAWIAMRCAMAVS